MSRIREFADKQVTDDEINEYYPGVEAWKIRVKALQRYHREVTLDDLQEAEPCALCEMPMFSDEDFARLGDNEADPDMQHLCMDCIE